MGDYDYDDHIEALTGSAVTRTHKFGIFLVIFGLLTTLIGLVLIDATAGRVAFGTGLSMIAAGILLIAL